MLLHLTEDQTFFRDTTARFLEEQAPPAEVRRLREDPAGFDEKYWRRGAELGWTSLLVGEAHGGGTVSGQGIVDLALIAYEFGRHAAPGPLLPTNVVAGALSDAGSHVEVLTELLAGTSVASWCDGVEIQLAGAEVIIRGKAAPVECASQAAYLLVNDEQTQALVPATATGVTVGPMQSVDLTRRFGAVTFDAVRLPATTLVGPPGQGADAVIRRRRLALVLAIAESVGTMQAAFDLTVAWAFDRYSFGRPLASYQALKHRFADMLSWLEGAHAISDSATTAVAGGAPDADELSSAAKAFVGTYGGELLQECVQLHGGIGVTFEHDLHLYLRRHTANTALYGTPAAHRQRLTDLIGQQEKTR
jgi:alkylation response protein AidB-like acyl-CoA dehydrogenase